jgi:hypothetical protein
VSLGRFGEHRCKWPYVLFFPVHTRRLIVLSIVIRFGSQPCAPRSPTYPHQTLTNQPNHHCSSTQCSIPFATTNPTLFQPHLRLLLSFLPPLILPSAQLPQLQNDSHERGKFTSLLWLEDQQPQRKEMIRMRMGWPWIIKIIQGKGR